MNWQQVRRVLVGIVLIVVLVLVGIYIFVEKPPFDHVMEVVRTLGELYLWPIVVLVLAGWFFHEPINRLIDRIRNLPTPLGTVEFRSIPLVAGHLDKNRPGNIFWLAHNLQHTQLRLELLWPKDEVTAMLNNGIYHAQQAKVPPEIISRLEDVKQRIIGTPQEKELWHEYAQELEVIFRTIAKVAENSHPEGDEFILPPG